jgi:hypothetical protein
MTDKTNKTKPKRLSKGGRIHVRRLKQIARKSGTVPNLPLRVPRPASVPKKEDLP